MMLRARLYIDGCDDWSSVTESSASNYGWSSAGLIWSWSYPTSEGCLNIVHANASGLTLSEVREPLAEHPEGFVLYCGRLPHAVYLIGFAEDGETLLCADPSYGSVMPLAASWLGSYGSQESILSHVTDTWYIAN